MTVRIQIFEDDFGDAELLRAYLAGASTCQHRTAWARRLSEGIASLEVEGADIILLDLGLPDSLGIGTFRSLHDKFPSIPIIVLSGLDDQDVSLTAVREGAQDYLVKGTFTEESLCRTIKYALERKKFERALQSAEERYRSIFDNAPVGIFRVDNEGRLLAANAELSRILGFRSSDNLVENKAVIGQLLDMDPVAFHDMISSLKRNGTIVGNEMRLERRDGFRRWISMSMRSVRDEKEMIRYVYGFLQDITDHKNLEILREDVDRIIRHDLKSPLTAIVNLPQVMLEADNLSEEQRRFLKLIEDNGHRMLRMITTSLKLFKLESGGYEIGRAPVDMLKTSRKLLEEIQGKTLAELPPVRVLLEGKYPKSGDVFYVEGEEVLCLSLLDNLIMNALEATRDKAEITLEFDGKSKTMIIRNKGAIAPEIRERLFEKYATYGKSGGTGLGLYSVKMIAQAHGWRIEFCDSKPGEVSCAVYFSPEA